MPIFLIKQHTCMMLVLVTGIVSSPSLVKTIVMKTHVFLPGRCSQCSYVATSRKQLRFHLSAHTGNRPHSCPYCDYRAACNKDLQKHIRTHTGEKPYQCELCPYRASDISNYRAHIKVKHKQRMPSTMAPASQQQW